MSAAAEDLMAEAVRVLTAAGRRAIADDTAPDFAAFLAEALAAAAANVGGVELILSGRPGSWEADFTRQLLCGTVGWNSEYLAEHRTEPVHVEIRPEELFYDLAGLDDPYDAARSQLDERLGAIYDRETATGEDITAAEAEVLAREERLEQLYADDLTAYAERLAAAVRAAAAARGITVPLHIEVVQEDARPYDEQQAARRAADRIGLELLDAAIEAVPLPGADQPAPLERLT